MNSTDHPLNRLRSLASAFSVDLAESATRVMATASAQFNRTGSMDMETEPSLSEIADAVERQAKAELNLHAIESVVYRHREEVAGWLRDPCYDLAGTTDNPADMRHLRAFAYIAEEAGSPNLANALYVLGLEKRVATLENRAALDHKLTDDDEVGTRLDHRPGV